MGAGQFVQRVVQEVALRGILAEERIKTGVTFFPMGEKFYADPYTPYRRLREKDPVHHSRLINGWMLTRYADVDAVLRDPASSPRTNVSSWGGIRLARGRWSAASSTKRTQRPSRCSASTRRITRGCGRS